MYETEIDIEDRPGKSGFKTFLKMLFGLAGVTLVVVVFAYNWITELNNPPAVFPVNQPITIESGTSVRSIAEILQEQGVIRSSDLLYFALVFLYEPTDIKASTYIFDEPLDTLAVAKRLVEGDFDSELIRFTHFEGERVTQIATRAAEILPEFEADVFVALAEPQEGKLYPETYFITEDFTAERLYDLMREMFDERTAPLETKIVEHPLTLEEILVLASIIEREADTPESKKLVSSVLQNRIEIGMALQADASIEYVLDKPLSELTPADLEIDSPYNTYLYPGLPPTPIGNPGMNAITAVLEPTESDYFFYITDDTGTFHFAETYNQHLRNIDVYLR